MTLPTTTVKCSWGGCPTHTRRNVNGKGILVLTWAGQVYFFHSTDCLAFWAGSFPIGYTPSGDEPNEEDE
jgi:hypothetical protein